MIKVQGLKEKATKAAKAFEIELPDFVNWMKDGIIGSYDKLQAKVPNVDVQIDLDSEVVGVYAKKIVVEQERDSEREIDLETLQLRQLKGKLGDYVSFDITSDELAGVLQAVLNIVDKVSSEELVQGASKKLEKWFNKKKDSVVLGKAIRPGTKEWWLDVGSDMEASLPASEYLEKDQLKAGAEILVAVSELKSIDGNKKIIVTRRADSVLQEALKQSVKEIADGSVSVMQVARIPGRANKVAVKSNKESINAIQACLGKDKTNPEKLKALLAGEQTEFIRWYQDLEKFIGAAIGQVPIKSITLNQAKREATVEVYKGGEGEAVGIGGENKQLAELLTGWTIKMTSSAEPFQGHEFDVKDKGNK